MTGTTALLMTGSASTPVPFLASITAGATASGKLNHHTFPTNTVTITGGTGPFTQIWSETDDSFGTWNTGGTSTTFTPTVTAVYDESTTNAVYVCTVTDTGTGNVVTSNNASYSYTNNFVPP